MNSSQGVVSTAQRIGKLFVGKTLPPDLMDRVKVALTRIQMLETNAQGYGMIDSLSRWLTFIAELPWNEQTVDQLSLKEAQKILDDGHYGQEEIKKRILEFISVQMLSKGNAKGMVLCFVGPPGTGKTTVSRIIAESLGRKFERISLAALGDLSQLRGKNRFLADAVPSLILKAIHHSGVKNPVICLDEIEKVGGEGLMGGEAMAAFLEILDPEQNRTFRDHFLDYPFDLSKVLFIATANKMLPSDNPVINRLEIISIPDYSIAEKEIIGKRFIIPDKLKELGLKDAGITVEFEQSVWEKLLDPYSWDTGMRTLQHTIGKIFYHIARESVETGNKNFIINAKNLSQYVLV